MKIINLLIYIWLVIVAVYAFYKVCKPIKIRTVLLGMLFTDEEKWLMNEALYQRIERIEITRLAERWADKDDLQKDIEDYKKIKRKILKADRALYDIFKTELK